jgi:murein DD-endopeptidase MepM/ murein hydrolase activator NlpD
MSFIMIAAGPTRCCAVRTVSMRAMVLGGGVAALVLLAAGIGIGLWASAAASPDSAASASPPPAHSGLPFAIEQLGALSGRLFKLESQAGQLSDQLRTLNGKAPKAEPAASAAGRGGPLLPPRQSRAALDELAALNERLEQIEQQIELVADAAMLQRLAMQRLPTRLPIQEAELRSSFGNREDPLTGRRAFHSGLDFSAAPGTPILASAAGTVVFAGFSSDFGWTVEIEHGNGLTTRYAHASRLHVTRGALVRSGDTIAAVGSSGRSTGPHLHFEVLHQGSAIDPRRYLAGL